MELKHSSTYHSVEDWAVLIVPYGIETQEQ